MNERSGNRLSTWKEIAAFLSCDVRTCLRWEKDRGLPIHRPEGGSKSRVYAWTDELETWLKGHSNGPNGTAPAATLVSPASDVIKPASSKEKSTNPRAGRAKTVRATAIVLVLTAGLFFGFRILTSDRNPADFRIDGSKLQIVNKSGKFLWEHDTGLKNLNTEEFFRNYFNKKGHIEDSGFDTLPYIIIRDINEDGRNEVLFYPMTKDPVRGGYLFCFDYRGKENWRFELGRELTYPNKTYSRDYWCVFDTGDFNGDGLKEVLVLAAQYPDWPSQVVLLSAGDRKRLGEYWNSGRIMDYLSADLDGDGKKELALCGTNGEYKRGIIIVFDPWKIGGASPNTGSYRSAELTPGTEKAYILLPWTDIDPVKSNHNWSVNIHLQSNDLIYILTLGNMIYFEIDPRSLECRYANFSNEFRAFHKQAVDAGRVSSVLDDAYLENLRTSLQYWTGSAWTTTPTWIR